MRQQVLTVGYMPSTETCVTVMLCRPGSLKGFESMLENTAQLLYWVTKVTSCFL